MRSPLLEYASIVRQRIHLTLVIRVEVAASGNVLEELALHAPLLMVASVIPKRVDLSAVIGVENATGGRVGQIEHVTVAVYVPLLEAVAVYSKGIHVSCIV